MNRTDSELGSASHSQLSRHPYQHYLSTIQIMKSMQRSVALGDRRHRGTLTIQFSENVRDSYYLVLWVDTGGHMHVLMAP